MPHQNEVYLMGHLVKAPETKHLSSGHSITTFTIPQDVGKDDRKRTVWVDVKAWNQPAAVLNLGKGTLVAVKGYLDVETWKDKQTGANRSKTVVVADMVSLPMWEKREKKEPAHRPQQDTYQDNLGITDEDVPF